MQHSFICTLNFHQKEEKKMAIIFFLSLFSLLFFTLSSSHIIPRFPYSVISPEQQLNSGSVQNGLYRTKFFTQILDHFNYNPQSYQKFQQRYLINDTYWGGAKKKAPIFVYTGNEGNIEWFTQNTGFMFEQAPYFNALLVFIEHRFYGKSIPFGGKKKVAYANSSTLGYLSSAQALADYATLIIDLKKNLSATESPVVVFGGSYGGMLAAWFRMKYPHVAIGALASSAPILQFDDLVSPYAFDNIITQDFRSESENCYKVIKGSWNLIEETAKKHGGLELLRKSFKICNNYIGVDALEGWLGQAWIYTAMTDYPTPTNFLSPLPAYPVRKACSEMIMPEGASSKESIFPESKWSVKDRNAYCKFAYNVVPRPNWITSEFGGHNIEIVLKRSVGNIIFFNGLRDPWSGGGVLKNISKTIIAIVAKEGAHHVDLRYSTKEDPKWLKDVRKQEVKIIESWISQYHQDLATK
ncbi:lysosomal pro-X carboxypeptidase-like protein [Medicago truncatula]|uniref:Lysosomal pro-X carboxypeptidase-like protein n=1 Tax=Medicago truncatula TaxID=3880 RepID=A0A072U4T9_MEDTR|nr:lysosomal pro-X carboxypeptidase-like protein [Medicago truncatula]